VDPSPGGTIAPISQAIHPSSSRRVTLRDISNRTSVRLNSNSRSNSLNTSSSIIRTVNREEISSRGRIIRHLVFLPQSPIRAVRQTQSKDVVEDASTMASRATKRCIVRRRWFNSSRPPMPQQDRMYHHREQAIVVRRATPWEAEPPGGRSSPGNTKHDIRYVLSRIPLCRSVI
jgi:hypothetical protein